MPQQSLRWSRILAIQSCPGCSQKLRVPDVKQGTVTCPHCGSEWFHPKTTGQTKSTTSGYIKWFASCGAIAFALIYYVYDARQSTLALQAKRDLDKAVNVLPLGTQEAWIGYVDRRIAAAIQSKAGALLVTDLSDQPKYLSRNTPYQVSCSPIMGGAIEFGYGENSTTVPIYGLLLDHSKAEKAPPPWRCRIEHSRYQSNEGAVRTYYGIIDSITSAVAHWPISLHPGA